MRGVTLLRIGAVALYGAYWGLSLFDRAVIPQRIPSDVHVDLASVYESLSGDGELAGFEVTDRYFEVGSPKGLHDLESWLRDRAAQPAPGSKPHCSRPSVAPKSKRNPSTWNEFAQ